MQPVHALLALAVVFIWGTNFVVIKVGLGDFPPLLFALLRFVFSAIPVLFLSRPNVEWKWLSAYGVFIGAGQFGLLFVAMRRDISPGLASLLIQMQVFFTMGLAFVLLKERLRLIVLAGAVIAMAGLAVIGWNLDGSTTPRGVAMVLGAAMCWAVANLVVKKAMPPSGGGEMQLLSFVAWSSLFAVPPLLVLCLVFEGPAGDWNALGQAGIAAWMALAWQAIGNTLFGFAAWGWLLSRYDAAVVSPYALLVPVFGLAASALLLGEELPAWKLQGATLVLVGIALITVVPLMLRDRLRPPG
ncbi:MAG TPA: EamA family transporter [Usitatibacter sp.]|nr:EamA family transporter [Usitatibacter sp.]